MEAIRLFLSIGLIIAAGLSVLQIVIRKDAHLYPRAGKIALSWCLGMGAVAFEMLVFTVAGLPFDLLMLIFPWIAVFIFSLFITERCATTVVRREDVDTFRKWPLLLRGLIAVMAIQAVSVFLRALSKPLESYDGVINFGIKSKIFFLNNGFLLDASSLEGIGKGHMDYPPLIPLIETWVYKFIGYHNDQLVKIIFPLTFVAFVFAFYFMIKRIFEGKYALLFTFLLCTIPQLVNFATVGYADLSFTYMVTIGFIFLFLHFREGKRSLLVLSSLFLGTSMLTKNEGISFVLASAVVIFMFAIRQDNKLHQAKKFFLCFALPLVILISPWIYVKAKMGLANTDIELSRMSLSRLLENAKQIPFILNKFQQEVFGPKKWNILWIMVFGFVVLRSRKFRDVNIRYIGIFILVNAAVYFASNMVITGKDLYFHVNTTLSRFMIHFTGVSLFLLAFLVFDDVKGLGFLDKKG